jgi:C1A family cysteine protease
VDEVLVRHGFRRLIYEYYQYQFLGGIGLNEYNQNRRIRQKLGWIPDYPDFRDFDMKKKELSRRAKVLGESDKNTIGEMIFKLGIKNPSNTLGIENVDLRRWCSPIEDQYPLGSCTAHAGVGLMEYFERITKGKYIDASRLFLYKVTRNLMKKNGDTGASIRATMASMALFGVLPERYYPYNPEDFDEEPPAFCYSYAKEYQAIQYYRLDPPSISRNELLNLIKTFLDHKLPSMFGTPLFTSYRYSGNDGEIAFPSRFEELEGGHAMMVVGYDNGKEIRNDISGGITTGAFLIRNSWGEDWGINGYGWLPYEYIVQGLAVDWWSLLKSEWIDPLIDFNE